MSVQVIFFPVHTARKAPCEAFQGSRGAVQEEYEKSNRELEQSA
jgi:hypothetical protein